MESNKLLDVVVICIFGDQYANVNIFNIGSFHPLIDYVIIELLLFQVLEVIGGMFCYIFKHLQHE